MIQNSLIRLNFLTERIPGLLAKIEESDFSHKPAPGKWSKKEILGHLVDSATNNHQRFIRGQYENKPTIGYDQNQWNNLNYYNQINSDQLIKFWTLYNKHLLELLKRIPEENLKKECLYLDGTAHTIAWLAEDYVVHQEHHLRQIVSY